MDKPKCICELCTCGQHHCPHTSDTTGALHFNEPSVSAAVNNSSSGDTYAKEPANELSPLPQDGGRSDNSEHTIGEIANEQSEEKPDSTMKSQHVASVSAHASSTARDDFREHPVQPRQRREVPQYEPSREPFDGTTTNSQTFTGQTLPKGQSFKPDNKPFASNAPFEGQTVAQSEYKPYPVQERQVKEAAQYTPSTQAFQAQTTSKDTFTGQTAARQKSFKPENGPVATDVPFEGVTTARSEYKEHPVQPRERREPDHYKPNTAPFQGHTTSKDAFTGQIAPKQKSFKPENKTVATVVPFEGATTARTEFREHPIQPRPQPETVQYTPNPAPFQGETTNKGAFTGQAVSKPKSFKPENKPVTSDVPFEAVSTTKSEFQKHPLEARYKKEAAQYTPNPEPFEAHTTSKDTFTGQTAARQKSFKPENKPVASDVPFEAVSTAKSEFQEHPVQARYKKDAAQYTPTREPFEAHTTSKDTFTGQTAARQKSFKPENKPVASDVPFEAVSTSKSQFPEHPVQERYKKEAAQYTPNREPFEAHTTSKDTFTGQAAARQKSYKPENNPVASDVPFEAVSTAKSEFQEHPVQERYKKEAAQYTPNPEPFEAHTTSKDTFTGQAAARQKSCKPENKPLASDVPFEAVSTAKSEFQEHPVQERYKKEAAQYTPNPEPFEAHTTSKDTFTGHPAARQKSFKLENKPVASDVPFQAVSTAKSEFQEHPVQERQQKDAAQYTPNPAPFQGQSTTKDSFTGQLVAKQKSFKPENVPLASDTPFESSTTARSEFKAHPVQARSQQVPAVNTPNPAPFQGQSTSKESFTAQTVPKQMGFKPENKPVASGVSFAGLSTTKSEYKEHPIQPRKSKEMPEYKLHPVPFQSETTNKETFKEHPLQARRGKEVTLYEPNLEPFEGKTTSQDSYAGHAGRKEKSFKPENKYTASSIPFESTSTTMSEYRGHPIQARSRPEAAKYVPTAEPFQGQTTNKETFTGQALPKQKSFKPENKPFASNAPFEGETTAGSDYKDYHTPIRPQGGAIHDTSTLPPFHDQSKPKSLRSVKSELVSVAPIHLATTRDNYREHPVQQRPRRELVEYQPNPVPFRGETTSKESFRGQTAPKQRSLKPNSKPASSYPPFDATTVSRSDYPDPQFLPR
ncbi:PREDICTED: uncharacterized protein LOC106821172 [Priapulus caudatus]|uniref:Uncharacterized protein LOC106821172 n=1 Tax=Priapulus caudatus TaxID=37621 RepID=A0ABM1FA80_PRICU|nr:PREDICTED: uncharacterized protein LOC106821172 [Priapulus caudatus]